MIVFDELDLERFASERYRLDSSVTSGIWKKPLELVRGDEVLTVSGWQTVTENAWQMYGGLDLTMKIIGKNKLWLDLPRFNRISGGEALAYTRTLDRNPRRVTSVEDVSVTCYIPLEELTIGHRVANNGRWVALSGSSLPADPSTKIKPKRVRLYAEGDPLIPRGFRPELVKLSDGTVAVATQSVLTKGLLSKIERGELKYDR